MSEILSDPGEDVIDRLSAALEHDEWINVHKYPLRIRAKDGRLFLEGTVENVAAKRRALVLAQQIVKERWPIEDLLRRKPTEHLGDRQLRDKVVKKLSTEPTFSEYTLRTRTDDKVETVHDAGPGAHEIVVHVDNGAVRLTGSVGSLSHWRLAEVLVWWTYACETLDNQLEVRPPEEDTDDEITDAVRIVLEKDPLVHADQVRVGTAGAVVHLDGLVASEIEKKYAVLDAWAVPGVWDVVDRIKV